MSVSLETVRRDLKDLAAAGFKVRENVGFRGVKRWRVEGFEDGFHLNITDLLSIYVGRRFLEPLAGTPFWDGQQKVFNKIRGALGEPALKYLQKLAKSFHATNVGASDYSERWGMIQRTDIQEIKRWIMGFGPNATVLEPRELVEEIQRDLEQMMSKYTRGSDQQPQRGRS